MTALAEDRLADGSITLLFEGDEPVEVLLDRAGTMPLPPYIASKRGVDAQDLEDYQTMFAREGRRGCRTHRPRCISPNALSMRSMPPGSAGRC